MPLLSVFALLGSMLCFAEAAVLVRRIPQSHPVAMNAVGMAVSALVLVGASLILGESLTFPHSVATWVALGYVSAVGSVVVFLLYVFVLQHWPASRAAYIMVLVPFAAVVLSAWLDNEPVSVGLVLGGLLVLTGVYVGTLRLARTSPMPAKAQPIVDFRGSD